MLWIVGPNRKPVCADPIAIMVSEHFSGWCIFMTQHKRTTVARGVGGYGDEFHFFGGGGVVAVLDFGDLPFIT